VSLLKFVGQCEHVVLQNAEILIQLPHLSREPGRLLLLNVNQFIVVGLEYVCALRDILYRKNPDSMNR
jgi:hypothetical protein